MGTRDREADVTERRLKHVYEFLDSGNNKKALQEADKLIKKHPNVPSLKGVKCLALIRMGKKTEGLEILDALEQQQPTDEFTLQAVTYCLKDLNNLSRVCVFYENAVKKTPTNEELTSHLFISYARIRDYKKQQTVAMQLYKLRPKNSYYIWTVMSVIFQGLTNAKLKDTMFFPLAEKMMKKLDADSGLDLEPEIQLYALIMEMQNKYEDALAVLNSNKERLKCMWEWDIKVVELLSKLNKWTDVWDLCLSRINNNTDNWFFFKHLTDAALRVHQLDSSSEESSQLDRTAHLAVIKLMFHLICEKVSSFEPLSASLETLVVAYVKQFGKLHCCFTDLQPFVRCLSLPLQEKVIDDLENIETVEPIDLTVTLLRLLIRNPIGIDEKIAALSRISQSSDLFSGVSEFHSQVDYAIIWIQLAFEVFQSTGDSNILVECVLLAEHIIRLFPEDFYIKVVLVLLYSRLGAAERVLDLTRRLDLKFVQRDTLGFLIYDLLPHFGFVSNFRVWCVEFEAFYAQSDKESIDAQIQCYRSGAFYKLVEFHEFNITLKKSLSSLLAKTSRVFIQTVFEEEADACRQELLSGPFGYRFTELESDPQSVKDLRDFSLLDPWTTTAQSSSDESFQLRKQQSSTQTLAYIQLQYHVVKVLSCLNQWKCAGGLSGGSSEQQSLLVTALGAMETAVQSVVTVTSGDLGKHYLNDPVVFWLCKMIQLDKLSFLLKFLTSFRNLVVDSPMDGDGAVEWVSLLKSFIAHSTEPTVGPLAVANEVLKMSCCVQTLSLVFIFLVTVVKTSDSNDTKGGGKKAKKSQVEANGDLSDKVHVTFKPWLLTLKSGFEMVLSQIKQLEPLCTMPMEHIAQPFQLLPEAFLADRGEILVSIYGSYRMSLCELRGLVEQKLVVVDKFLSLHNSS